MKEFHQKARNTICTWSTWLRIVKFLIVKRSLRPIMSNRSQVETMRVANQKTSLVSKLPSSAVKFLHPQLPQTLSSSSEIVTKP